MSVQENIKSKNAAIEKLTNHPMCLRIEEGKSHSIVVFPFEVEGLGGVRVENSARGIEKAIEFCEQSWIKSYPGYRS